MRASCAARSAFSCTIPFCLMPLNPSTNGPVPATISPICPSNGRTARPVVSCTRREAMSMACSTRWRRRCVPLSSVAYMRRVLQFCSGMECYKFAAAWSVTSLQRHGVLQVCSGLECCKFAAAWSVTSLQRHGVLQVCSGMRRVLQFCSAAARARVTHCALLKSANSMADRV